MYHFKSCMSGFFVAVVSHIIITFFYIVSLYCVHRTMYATVVVVFLFPSILKCLGKPSENLNRWTEITCQQKLVHQLLPTMDDETLANIIQSIPSHFLIGHQSESILDSTPAVITWSENVVSAEGEHRRKLGILEHHDLINVDEGIYHSVQTTGVFPMTFQIPFVYCSLPPVGNIFSFLSWNDKQTKRKSNDLSADSDSPNSLNEDPLFPINNYLSVIRVHYTYQVMHMHQLVQKRVGKDLPELQLDVSKFVLMTSRKAEKETLSLTYDRFSSFQSSTEQRLTSHPYLSYESEVYASSYAFSLSLIQYLVDDVDELIVRYRLENKSSVILTDYPLPQYWSNWIANNTDTANVSFLADEKNAIHVAGLVSLYIRETLLPYINEELRMSPVIPSEIRGEYVTRFPGTSVDSQIFLLDVGRAPVKVGVVTRNVSECEVGGEDGVESATLKPASLNVTVSTILRTLYAIDNNGTAEDIRALQAKSNDFGGSMTFLEVDCVRVSVPVKATEDLTRSVVDSLSLELGLHDAGGYPNPFFRNSRVWSEANGTTVFEYCVPKLEMLGTYNYLILSASLAFSPAPLTNAPQIKRHEDTSSSEAVLDVYRATHEERRSLRFMPSSEAGVRFLIVGLGGGELHGYLLKHFANAVVDSVDVDSTIIRVAGAYMGMDTVLCEYYSLVNSSSDDATLSLRLDHRVEPGDASMRCRSRIIHADACTLIEFLRSKLEAEADDGGSISIPTLNSATGSVFQQYDYIVFDAFLPTPFSFINESISEDTVMNPVFGAISTERMLQSIKQLLVPDAGIASFHAHMDYLYPSYLRAIHTVFGSASVAEFVVTNNDRIIAGRRGNFINPNKDTTVSDRELDGVVETTTTDATITNYTTICGASVTTISSTVTTVNLTKTRTLAAYHPCEDQVGFAQYVRKLLTDRYGLDMSAAVSSKHSLLCQNFTY